MKCKRGQFYLVAAIIIIAFVAGFVTISNYSKRKTSIKIYDLGEELGIESQNVLEYGNYNSFDETEMDALLEQFIEDYVAYAGEDKNLYFLFGDANSIKIKPYQEIEESVSVGGSDIIITGEKGETMPVVTTDKIVIIIEDIEYHFDLDAEQNFYFVISQEIDGEKHVVTG
jgi:hypothetical protein